MEPKRILFIVSDPVDIIITQMVFRDSQFKNELLIISHTEYALRFIRREMPYENEELPDLIIVDFSALSDAAWDFIKEVKSDDEFKRVPLLVFVLNRRGEEIGRLYDLNVNCCIHKPVDLEEFTMVVEGIEKFWLSSVNYSNRARPLLRKAQNSN